MKPIFVIDDFSQGISYDETENTVNGFHDLEQIDLKNINGVAMLSNDYHNSFSTSNFVNTNHFTEKKLIPDVAFTGNSQIFGLKADGSTGCATVYIGNTSAKDFSVLHTDTGGSGCPKYAESIVFQNRLFYPYDKTRMNSASLWTTGNVQAITANGTTTLDIASVSGAKIQTADKSLEGGTIYLWTGSAWITRTVVTYLALQFTVNTSVTAGDYYAYIVSPVANVKKADGTSTTLTTANQSTIYRPMVDHGSKLYVGDADMIYSLDSTLTNWKTTNGDGAISVGSDYTVKQMKELGGYIYILADRIDSNFANTFTAPTNYTPSKIYIWDGTSVGFSNIVDIGTHCFCIEAIENRIYGTLQSNKDDGILFGYFNGSDFPTIAKFQLPSASMPVAGITYDRGRFYFAVNSDNSDIAIVSDTYIYSYSSYAIESQIVAKQYHATGTSSRLNSIDLLKLGASPLFTMNDGGSTANNTFYRNNLYASSGNIITQKYEITPNQFGQLIKGIQLNFKETMTSDCSVLVKYRGDENTAYTTAGTISSANQNNVLYGIMQRFKKIQVQLILQTNTQINTPRIVKISLY